MKNNFHLTFLIYKNMKYIKLYEGFKEDIDIFDEEDWNENESDGSFLWWLKREYSNENTWKNITDLNCSYNKLISLKGIENLINLKELYCSYNNLTNLNGIKNLTKLKNLNCNDNNLINLEIQNLTNLTYLNCNSNQLENLNEIENLTNLKYLYCHHNNIENLNGIEKCTNLKILICNNNNFTNEYKEYLFNYYKKKIKILI
jgi:internalin A